MTNIVLNASPAARPLGEELRAAAPTKVGGSGDGVDAGRLPSVASASGPAAKAAPGIPGHDTLLGTVEHLNGLMQVIRRELHFSIDDESGRTVIKVIDAETQEVIRNIPPEEVANVAQYLDTMSGAGLTAGVHA